MSFLLDTNAIIAILNGRPLAVRDNWVAATSAGAAVATSSIVVFELFSGAYKSGRREENVQRLQTLLSSSLEVLPLDIEDADRAGQIRASLEAKGHPIGPYDLLIAGQAMQRGLTLVTANTSEFRRVKGLSSINWGRS